MRPLLQWTYGAVRQPFYWAPIVFRQPGYLGLMLHWSWLKARRASPLSEGLPWITQSALQWMDQYLRPNMKVFEWGSGGSTVYFARRTASVASIEHDRKWYENVRASLDRQQIRNCELRCIEPVPEIDSGWEETLVPSTSGLPQYDGLSFRAYVDAIREYPDGHFDLVFIDGRARMGCLHAALEKVSASGALVLDNSEYPRYQRYLRLPGEWVRTDFDGPGLFNNPTMPSRTTVWRRRQS